MKISKPISRPPIQTPVMEKDGQRLTRPWNKFLQEVQEQINRSGVFIEGIEAQLPDFQHTIYSPGTEFYAVDTGHFFVLTGTNGWVRR